MSREIKPQIYYLCRRGWYDQLLAFCDGIIKKKGKDPATMYWRAFAMGMTGNVSDCLRTLESFQSRKDMSYAVNLALMHFHKRAPQQDREAISMLRGEQSVAEDVTKEAGFVLAARFALYTGEYRLASTIAEKLSANRGGRSGASMDQMPSTAFEVEGYVIEKWCELLDIESTLNSYEEPLSADLRKRLQTMDSTFNDLSSSSSGQDIMEPDGLMLWCRVKQLLGLETTTKQSTAYIVNVLNQCIAAYPAFIHALGDKAMLLASAGEWEQALDTAQRLLDGAAQVAGGATGPEHDPIDALTVIAVHAFVQDGMANEAVTKLEELDVCIAAREPHNAIQCSQTAALFSSICGRQPRALQICARMLDRCVKGLSGQEMSAVNAASTSAHLLCELGFIQVKQGPSHYDRALKCFRDASKRDGENIRALEGMILTQLCDGAVDDAEAQIELLYLMRSEEELDKHAHFAYLRSLLLKGKNQSAAQGGGSRSHAASGEAKKEHVESLMATRERFVAESASSSRVYHAARQRGATHLSGGSLYMNAFADILAFDADFAMVLATDLMTHLEATNIGSLVVPSNSSLLTGGGGGASSGESKAAGGSGATTMGASSSVSATQQSSVAASMTTAAYSTIAGAGAGATSYVMDSPSKSGQSGGGGGGGAPGLSAEISPPVAAALELLNKTIKRYPGMINAYVEVARCYHALGMYNDAVRSLTQCLGMQPQCAPVLIMLAKMEASKFSTVSADRHLEQALSCDFSVRGIPLFKLVKALVRSQQGKQDEALTEIEQLLAGPEFGFSLAAITGGSGGGGDGSGGSGGDSKYDSKQDSVNSITTALSNMSASYADPLRLTEDDRVGVYVAYASLLSKLRRMKEANKVLSHAKVLYSGGPQEVQVLVAASQLYVEKNDFDAAIRMLDKISEDSPTYSRAQLIKADIILTHNHDKEGFTKCYAQLAEREPSSKHYALLGEAYLRILNPEAAVEAFEKAFEMDPTNGRLRGRIGQALVATHEYHRAVEFYEAAIREVSKAASTSSAALVSRSAKQQHAHQAGDGNAHLTTDLVMLSHDLAKLYIQLGRAESSTRVLLNVLHGTSETFANNSAAAGNAGVASSASIVVVGSKDPRDVMTMRQDVTSLLLLARVYQQAATSGGKKGRDNVRSSGESNNNNSSSGYRDMAFNCWQEAYSVQRELLLRLRSSMSMLAGGDTIELEKNNLSDICCLMGEWHLSTTPLGNNGSSSSYGSGGSKRAVEGKEGKDGDFSAPSRGGGGDSNSASSILGAEKLFQEAVSHNPQNIKAMVALAQIMAHRGDKEQSIGQCTKILLADPRSEAATVLMSAQLFLMEDLGEEHTGAAFGGSGGDEGKVEGFGDEEKNDKKKETGKGSSSSSSSSSSGGGGGDLNSVAPLKKFLALEPNNYVVLAKAVSLLRRAGKLEEVPDLLAKAEKNDRRSASHPGYHFACGMYARFTNDIGKAIVEFNLARRDDVWGTQALCHMIELYLNPDQEGVWEEKEMSGPLDENTRANIAAAEELLRELRPRATDTLRVRVLENYCALSTRAKPNVDKAMQSFVEILDSDQDYLPAVLGMATGFMIEKNQHKARNLLKRVGKMELNQHDGEDFEKANLLLAKFYIDKGKNDLAQELCKKTLAQNKSCGQAWEILGLIMEKDSNYELAADCYGKAWKLEFEASASVGFKLAFCRLKSRQFLDTIDVCEAVLAMYPDYPRIREEILQKAQQSIRKPN